MLYHAFTVKMASYSQNILPETFTEPVTPSSIISELEEGEIEDDEDPFETNLNSRTALVRGKDDIANRENCVPKSQGRPSRHASSARRESSSSWFDTDRNFPMSHSRWSDYPPRSPKSRQSPLPPKTTSFSHRFRRSSPRTSSRSQRPRSGSNSRKSSSSQRKTEALVKDTLKTVSPVNEAPEPMPLPDCDEFDRVSSPESVILLDNKRDNGDKTAGEAEESISIISLSSNFSTPTRSSSPALNEEELQLKLTALRSLVGASQCAEQQEDDEDATAKEEGGEEPMDIDEPEEEEELYEDLLRAQLLVAMTRRKRQEIDSASLLGAPEDEPPRPRTQSPPLHSNIMSPVSIASIPSPPSAPPLRPPLPNQPPLPPQPPLPFQPPLPSQPPLPRSPPPSLPPLPPSLPQTDPVAPYHALPPQFPSFHMAFPPPPTHFASFQPAYLPARRQAPPLVRQGPPVRSNLVSVPLSSQSLVVQRTVTVESTVEVISQSISVDVEAKKTLVKSKNVDVEVRAEPPLLRAMPLKPPLKTVAKSVPQLKVKSNRKLNTIATPTVAGSSASVTTTATVKTALLMTIPKPAPLIISLNGDSTEDEDDEEEAGSGTGYSTPTEGLVSKSASNADLGSLVDQYLKGTREKMAQTQKSQTKNTPSTPQALKHLSESQQEEYRRLKREIERRECQRLKLKAAVNNNDNETQPNRKDTLETSKKGSSPVVTPVPAPTHPSTAELPPVSGIDATLKPTVPSSSAAASLISMVTNSVTRPPTPTTTSVDPAPVAVATSTPPPLPTVANESISPSLSTAHRAVTSPRLPSEAPPTVSQGVSSPLETNRQSTVTAVPFTPKNTMPCVPAEPMSVDPPLHGKPKVCVTLPGADALIEANNLEERKQKREEFEKKLKAAQRKMEEWTDAQKEWKDAIEEVTKLRQAMLRAQTRKEKLQGTLDVLSTDLRVLVDSLPEFAPTNADPALGETVSRIRAVLSHSSAFSSSPVKGSPAHTKPTVFPKANIEADSEAQEMTVEGQKVNSPGDPVVGKLSLSVMSQRSPSPVTQLPKQNVSNSQHLQPASSLRTVPPQAVSDHRPTRRRTLSQVLDSNTAPGDKRSKKTAETRPAKQAKRLHKSGAVLKPLSPKKGRKPAVPVEHWKGEAALNDKKTEGSAEDLSVEYESPISWKESHKRVIPEKPLCPFFLMGSCLDPRCRYQHLTKNHGEQV